MALSRHSVSPLMAQFVACMLITLSLMAQFLACVLITSLMAQFIACILITSLMAQFRALFLSLHAIRSSFFRSLFCGTTLPLKIKQNYQRVLEASVLRHTQSRREGRRETATNYQGLAVRKGARGPTMLHTFFPLSVVSLFVDCTN